MTIPVSATQYRAATGDHQNKIFENNSRSNITHTSVINRDNQHDLYEFPLALTHVRNSPDAMSRQPEQLALRQSTVLLFLQLLSQIRPIDSPLSAASGNSVLDCGRDVIPASYSDNRVLGLSVMLSPVVNALHETGQFIARHDPLKFMVRKLNHRFKKIPTINICVRNSMMTCHQERYGNKMLVSASF